MSRILELIRDREVRRFEPGQIVMGTGAQTHCLYVLIDGKVEVVKDDVRVSTISEPGATFGEISALLGGDHARDMALRDVRDFVCEHTGQLGFGLRGQQQTGMDADESARGPHRPLRPFGGGHRDPNLRS